MRSLTRLFSRRIEHVEGPDLVEIARVDEIYENRRKELAALREKYPTGTLVRLKSGGPTMTVALSPGSGMMPGFGEISTPVKVSWFDELGVNHEAYFSLDTLEVV